MKLRMDTEYAEKRKIWLNALDGPGPGSHALDDNSIAAQIMHTLHDAAVFRVVIKSRELSERDNGGRIKCNRLVHQLFDKCFFQSQLMSIRRLLDGYDLNGERGVNSLRAILDDMKKSRAILTRKNIVASHVERKIELGILSRECGSLDALDVQDIEGVDLNLDRLCGVQSNQRNQADAVAEIIFDTLLEKIRSVDNIMKAYVDKFIAHAATRESRNEINPWDVKITLDDVWRAHEIICRIFCFMDNILLRSNETVFLPPRSASDFKYIDVPLLKQELIPKLQQVWKNYEEEISSLYVGNIDWIFSNA